MQEQKKKKASISDIAKLAGVSSATVSRVLSDSAYPVKPELQARVLEAAKRLQYQSNIFSQILKGNESREIGVIVPSVTNPFYAELVDTVSKVCVERGYIPLFFVSQDSTQLEKRYLESLNNKQVTGVLISCLHLEESLLERLTQNIKAFVLFDQIFEDAQANSVSFDFFQGGCLATNYLLECGHRDIAFLSGALDRPSRKEYFSGYKHALKSAGLRFNNRRLLLYTGAKQVSSNEDNYECGWALGQQLYEGAYLPDAIVAINDMVAIGAIRYLESKGIQVPNDISVIGFDNISLSALTKPALTTINQSSQETGRLAAKILMDQLEEIETVQKQIVLQPSLIERESVRKINRKIRK